VTTGRIALDGQVAVVTGAGGGLGRSHALELSRRGASVVVNDIMLTPGSSGPGADAVVREIEEAGGEAVASDHSVAAVDGAAALVGVALDRFGSVDVIVHNAGNWRNVPIEEMTADNLDPVLDVHLRGAFFLIRPAWKVMVENGFGRIVLTSSGAGAFGRVKGANYVAAKAGLLGLGRALALEGSEYGIMANCILPLAVTPTNSTYLANAARQEPERVSPLVAYLSSRECTVSGEAFSVGLGGHVARVFVAVTSGWWTGDAFPTAEDIAGHMTEIEDRSSYSVPASVIEQMQSISGGVSGEIV
jgi:NAD(P)-dependent dehydrogenase (short-subunit alcohol dehydrogenase family)